MRRVCSSFASIDSITDRFSPFSQDLNAKLFFEHTFKVGDLSSSLFLSNIEAALPTSSTLRDKNIKAVISILQPKELSPAHKSMTQLYAASNTEETIYQDGLDTVVYCKANDILYYNLCLADVSDPEILSKPSSPLPHITATQAYLRVVWFMRHWLSSGDNVLVHCEKGQRRSPTAILAFLVSQGARTHQALETLGSAYSGGDSVRPWVEGYKRTRHAWITKLQEFETVATHSLVAFPLSFPKLAHAMQGLKWTAEDQQRIDELKKQKVEVKPKLELPGTKKRASDTQIEPVVPAKKYKLAAKPMLPGAWANRKK